MKKGNQKKQAEIKNQYNLIDLITKIVILTTAILQLIYTLIKD